MKKQKINPTLDSISARIEPHYTWEDLVLTKEKSAKLHQIVYQVRMRNNKADYNEKNRGVIALFTGRGTINKGIAVQFIANDLGFDLFRIDLSSVVNKYRGETEINLRRLLNRAEESESILFFDEADTLFGKRSEVKDSHDRNIKPEINYLLQRMEEYRGLVILATDKKSALDSAFLRRFQDIVTFPMPSASDRELIWQKAFPTNSEGSTKHEADGEDPLTSGIVSGTI
jgi:SpoVK/Ycf46/Vps4 family AAA+-type ATPase